MVMQGKKRLEERLEEALEKGHISEQDAREIIKLSEIED